MASPAKVIWKGVRSLALGVVYLLSVPFIRKWILGRLNPKSKVHAKSGAGKGEGKVIDVVAKK